MVFTNSLSSYYEKFLATGEVKCIDEEIPFEIPKGWEWSRMGSIGDWGAGATPAKGNTSYYGGNILWLRTGELNNSIVNDTEIKITDKALKECSLRMNKAGDVLIAMYGATIGKVAIAGCELTTNQACCACTPIGIFNYYLFYFLMESQVDFIKKGEGGAQPNISREKLVAHLMPIPPIQEQHRIVERIKDVLPLIDKYALSQIALDELNRSINDKLKKSILQEAIQGKLVPQIVDEGTAQELLEQIKLEKQKLIKDGKLKKSALTDSVIYKGDDNKYFEKIGKTEQDITDEIPFDIPNTWVWVRHNDLFDISGGSQPPKSKFIEREKEGYIRLFQIRDYGSNPQPIYIPLSTASKISQKGDILLARYGASLGKVFYAEYGAYNVALAKVIPLYESRLIFQKYIFLYYCSSIYQNEIVNRSRCAQAGFNKEDLNSLLFPLPPLSEQYRIVEKYEKAIASIMRG
ncbi:restriction endonuclease subunit S [Bacteroides uniformis]|uniref:restriction endonuclease subunit S n=1 Tax=Bacteroides uniformis TaxID=820 RepID=UPI00319E142B